MQDILIHARDFRERTPAAYYGARTAVRFGASITGIHVCPSPVYFAPAIQPELMSTVVEEARRHVQGAINARRSFVGYSRDTCKNAL